MKTRFAILVVLLAASFQALSQEVENDDMYFTAKDRAKQNVRRTNERIAAEKKLDADSRTNSAAINPTDSYSARNINPEYVSRARTEAEDTVDGSGYFENSYSPSGVNNKLYRVGNAGDFYSPYYGNGYGYNGFNNFGPGFGGFYSPYYGGFSPGMSIGLGYGMGSFYNGWYGGMGYGWGMPSNYFWNSYYYDPFMYSGFCSPWNSWAWGGYYRPWGGYGYGWPGSVIVINNDNTNNRNIAHQRRFDRSSSFNNNVTNTTRTTAVNTTRNGRPISSGRVNSESAQSQNYYQRGWRSSPSTTQSQTRTSQWNSGNNGSTSTGRTRSTWSNPGNDNGGFNNSWNNGGGSNSRSSWSGGNSGGGSRSSWSGGGSSYSGGGSSGGGSRSGGGSSSGGGGGTRGRH